ncbi:MAG: hypothetical protein Q4E35_07500, partial [Eubacteriales bacterium]|nr:hypothetical protein [Eubacteriales bacterium]
MKFRFYDLVDRFFCLCIAVVLVLLFFFSSTSYTLKKDFCLPNIVFLLVGVFLILVFSAVTDKTANRRDKQLRKKPKLDRFVYVFSLILFVWQLYVCKSILFITDWDAGAITNASVLVITGEGWAAENNYSFSYYPNNLLLLFIESFLMTLNRLTGLFKIPFDLMCLASVGCAVNSASCLLVYKTARLLCTERTSLLAYFLSVITIGISPWVSVFYSDTLCLFVPILVIYLYIKPKNSKLSSAVHCLLIAFVSIIGYYLKPTCAIPLISAALIELFSPKRSTVLKKILDFVCMIAGCVLIALFVSKLIDYLCLKIWYFPDPNKRFGITHFFNMGLNTQTDGGFYYPDVAASMSYKTVSERSVANLHNAFERIKELGVIGLLEHLKKKLLLVFNDGTFAWGVEGFFIVNILPETTRLSHFLRQLYYSAAEVEGALYPIYKNSAQLIWVSELSFVLLAGFTVRKDRKKEYSTFFLCIIGIFLYEILFEARARYIYIFVPLFALLAAVGISRFCASVNNFISKSKALPV